MVVGRAVNINSKSKGADKVSQAAPAVKSTDMAAAAMAKKHVMGAAKVVYDPTREKMPGDAECWITGELGRQIVTQVGVSYQRRFVKVSKDSVCFGKMGCPIMIDYVPVGGSFVAACARACVLAGGRVRVGIPDRACAEPSLAEHTRLTGCKSTPSRCVRGAAAGNRERWGSGGRDWLGKKQELQAW